MLKKNSDQTELQNFITQKIEQQNAFELLDGVCEWFRSSSPTEVREKLKLFLKTLAENETLAQQVSSLLARWICSLRLYPLFVSTGILGREGFSQGFKNRLYDKFNPSFKDKNDLRDVFYLLFNDSNDELWINEVSLNEWRSLFNLLAKYTPKNERERLFTHLRQEGLLAIEMLAVWVAAEELEPELMRLDPILLDRDSPFVALQREVFHWLNAHRQEQEFEKKHLEVMYSQSLKLVERLRKRGAEAGSSLAVAHLLERLKQTLERLGILLHIFSKPNLALSHLLRLVGDIAISAVHQHSLADLMKQSVGMLSRTITQNTSDHGEHYITRNKKEYFSMFFSAAGGGVIIALMALFKIYLGTQIEDKVWLGLAEGLNYGLGFTLIFMLHCTVATKQPAMTAARFAEAVERNPHNPQSRNMKLAQLLIDVFRSQSIAVIGNVLIAISVAATIAYYYFQHFGMPLLDEESISYQLSAIDPTKGTLWYAAIAGVWLFLAGIISGYFDNRSNYLNSRMRLRQHPCLKLVMTEKCRNGFADYIHDSYGSIMGNLSFGMLLGITGVIGYLLSLPLDIRHVAFSSANLGYAVVSGSLGWEILWKGVGFVLLIGLVNLIVSFSLTLWLALRSLNAKIDSWWDIFICMLKILRKKPLSLFLPMQLDK
ncbi:recombinase [Mannheimia sp. AT1]|uniref:Recombinase n=1 Tax=Mannheimia cairinae TaxID=3025936 RepID=A0ABT5MQG6_9PAST|nr:recombinase [Mannheimia cairinae]MDD0824412.1 recombinase [Mannheimia cairinae]MDD0825513.1 recombinase [Mannheimia cairinae]